MKRAGQPAPAVLTGDEVRAHFVYRGLTMSQWARERGYDPGAVSDVICGKAKGRRGVSHDIAVELGMKVGVLNKARRGGQPRE